MADLPKCSEAGCDSLVSKAGYTLCYKHWLAESKKKSTVVDGEKTTEQVKKKPSNITATGLGELFNVSSRKVNKVLLDLGWIKKTDSGWVATEQGLKLMAQTKSAADKQTYIIWPYDISKSGILKRAIAEYLIPQTEQTQPEEILEEFRGKRPGTIRTSDGHFVRSRAEAMIDGWLYENEIIHVYEKALPIDEVLICDFFIPAGNVYIEFWGLENDPKYLKRKQRKLEIYKENNFNLIELNESDLNSLDDHLPRKLRKFGINLG